MYVSYSLNYHISVWVFFLIKKLGLCVKKNPCCKLHMCFIHSFSVRRCHTFAAVTLSAALALA